MRVCSVWRATGREHTCTSCLWPVRRLSLTKILLTRRLRDERLLRGRGESRGGVRARRPGRARAASSPVIAVVSIDASCCAAAAPHMHASPRRDPLSRGAPTRRRATARFLKLRACRRARRRLGAASSSGGTVERCSSTGRCCHMRPYGKEAIRVVEVLRLRLHQSELRVAQRRAAAAVCRARTSA